MIPLKRRSSTLIARIGASAFGKGLVQAVRGLADGSGLTVTIAKYLTPKGTDIHKNGIQPDINAAMSEKELKIFSVDDLGTEKDSQYMTAEGTLVKQLNKIQAGRTYKPIQANLNYALR